MEDNELLNDFVIESKEHLADVENQFLAIEEQGANIDVDLINEVFRAIHSIKGAAGFLGLTTVNDLAHSLENLLNMMRNRELAPTSAIVDVMLKAADTLTSMIDDVHNSSTYDISHHVESLEAIAVGAEAPTAAAPAAPPEPVADEAAPSTELTLDEQIEAAIAAKLAAKNAAKAAEAPQPAASPAPPEPPQAKPMAEESSKPSPTADANIRVSVTVLDSLMNLAGELVLSRNQLMQAVASEERSGLEATSARIDQVTSELQEAIMQTRMQQIGSVFSRFPRVVRDLSAKLGKQCELEIEGKEVEVDKTIVEAIGDPLTHLIRNSVDHGLESPDARVKNGKPASGKIELRACYQAGKVRIEINDDGGGINPAVLKEKAVSKGVITQEKADQMGDREAVRLIFAPGFSTAKEVTDVSGRGVGMDVVRTNIAKLGGTVDVESVLGKGTSIIVTLPLTLAIIPSLIIQAGGDRFAIPQVNIAELVRVRESERETKLGRVKNAEVLRLRGSLLPLVRLNEALNCGGPEEDEHNKTGATNIIVVDTGQTRFGLVVDALHDSEEIVVKPLGRHHKNCRTLAGATILGDGHVALILDIAGIAAHQDLRTDEELQAAADKHAEQSNEETDEQAVMLFENGPGEQFAAPMALIARIERIRTDQIDTVAGQEVLQYKSTTLPLLRLENCIRATPPGPMDRAYVVVFEVRGREVGLIAPVLHDITNVTTNIDTATFSEQGVVGSLVRNDKTVRLIDFYEITQLSHPEWFLGDEPAGYADDALPPLVLLAEDSTFFRTQVQKMFEDKGYRVEACEDGQVAWDKLASGEYAPDVVVTDIEMPNMDGFQLCQKIRDSAQFRDLPVIALTSLAGTSDIQRGIEVGIDDYQIKMDREKLLNSLRNFVDHGVDRNKNQSQLVEA
ncbi:Chemotaxis protein CheA [Posidoniimonas corsicana]|uniref:histidine kinase n=1 Tax=Posidoniimonas corsicana TaxID=1938618 RepID=A0A5C5VDJ1_9BACT|nr:chemotaxis protein CheW [Posidoniimonas corsicana]TWT36063.1 Chemotaxis protein CheA [Posidoniimonas corsicana]